jgi:aldehyde:ferredoxin oxidoreductase
MYGGYVGKILRVDLSTGKIANLNTLDYVPTYIGGIGLGYRILWDETNESTSEWSPENPLIFASGPLCGTPSPTSGRAEVIGLAPQGYPKPWAAVAGFGGDFGPKMKFAGYDAIVITGKAESPKYLYVSEKEVELRDAAFVWGQCTYPTQEAMVSKHGDDVAVACIGPAGENRVRWAIIQSRSENAAGQGGFGAVMGDKKLKAITIKPGTVRVPVAHPEKLIAEVVKVTKELSPLEQAKGKLTGEQGSYTTRRQSCAWSSCTGGVAGCLPTYYNKIPQKVTGFDTVSGVIYCVGGGGRNMTSGNPENRDPNREIAKLCDALGLNHWEAFAGMNWFMQNCQNAGKLPRILGEEVKLKHDGPAVYPKTGSEAGMTLEFAVKFLKAVAFREGEGDIWAEGTPRAAEKLGLEAEARKTHKFGYGPHWDGRYLHFIRYPVWVVSALSWATQGRDPFNHQHGYVERYPSFVKEWQGEKKSAWGTETMPYAELCKAGAKLYDAPHANDGWDKPDLGYVDKEHVAIWHDHRAIIKSSVPACDRQFPLLYDSSKPDRLGDFEAELRLFNAVVGTGWSMDDMHKACEKIFSIMRSIHVRQGRSRKHDESVMTYFEQPDMWPDDPGPSTIDRKRFGELLDRFYAARGWDKSTGRPSRARLEKLGLRDVADALDRLPKTT